MYKRKRYFPKRQGLRQKPWNKPQKIDKFWVPAQETVTSSVYTLDSGFPATVCAQIFSMMLTGEPSSPSSQVMGDNVKLHRFDGAIYAWLAPMDQAKYVTATSYSSVYSASPPISPVVATQLPQANAQMLGYAWRLETVEESGNSVIHSSNVSDLTPTPSGPIAQMLRYKNLLRWGNILVHGQVPLMYTPQTNGGGSAKEYLAGSMDVSNAGMLMSGGIAKIPFPRVPKGGFNMIRGKELRLYVGAWAGPMSRTTDEIDVSDVTRSVIIYPQYRMLCSL